MDLTIIHTSYILCFLLSLKDHYCNIIVCDTKYNHHTARYECVNMGGIMVSMDMVYLNKDLIFEKSYSRGIHKTQFWLRRTQGLMRFNGSADCSPAADKCPYVQMKNNAVFCKATDCSRKFQFLCEIADKPIQFKRCVSLSTFSAPRALGRAKVDNPSNSDLTTSAERTTVPKSQPTKIFQTDHHCNINVCNTKYNHHTARYQCVNMGGIMVSMDMVNLNKNLIFENIFSRGIHKRKFWLKRTQGLMRSNDSADCNTAANKCPYVQMKNDAVFCKATDCRRKFQFLCEIDEQPYSRHCISTSKPSMKTPVSTECYGQENITMNNSYTSYITNASTVAQRLPKWDKRSSNILFILVIVLCIVLSLVFLLSTIHIVLKRRLSRLKVSNQIHSIMDDGGEFYFKDYSHMKPVQRISIQSLTYSSMLMMKEECQEETTADKSNVYSQFSVQSSVYDKLKRSRKRSRKKNTSDPDVYSTMNTTQLAGLETTDTNKNDGEEVVDEGKTLITNEEDCFDIALDGHNEQYYPIKEVSKVKESDNSALTNDTQIHTIQSSLESPKEALSGDYEMAKNLLVNGNDTKRKSCRILDHEMARL